MLGIGVFFLFNQKKDSRDESSSTPPDSELTPDNRGKLENPIHATNLDPEEEEHTEEIDEENNLLTFPKKLDIKHLKDDSCVEAASSRLSRSNSILESSVIPDSTGESASLETDSNESTTRSNKYIRLARMALGDNFIPPSGVNPIVTQEEGLVVVTYPFEHVTRNGIPVPGPDYHVQVKFNASTDEVVSIQAGS